MIPRAIIPNIFLNHALRPLQLLLLLKQIKPLHQPLSIAPDVIILRILLQHCSNEIRFAFGGVEFIDDGLPVVPDLVVLEVSESRGVEPGDFFVQVFLEFGDRFGAV